MFFCPNRSLSGQLKLPEIMTCYGHIWASDACRRAAQENRVDSTFSRLFLCSVM